ncbi:Os07g0693400, partial [Oryza sativa Japonica Group]
GIPASGVCLPCSYALCSHFWILFAFLDSESFQFLSRYFIYTAKDLEEWSENPESFHHEQNLVQWTEKQRPCAEALFIVIFENYREVCTS